LFLFFFSIVDTCLNFEDIAPTKFCDGSRMAIFCVFLHPVFSASRVQHISDMHSKLAPRPHHVWYTSNLRRPKIGEETRKIETTAAIYNGLPYWAAIKTEKGGKKLRCFSFVPVQQIVVVSGVVRRSVLLAPRKTVEQRSAEIQIVSVDDVVDVDISVVRHHNRLSRSTWVPSCTRKTLSKNDTTSLEPFVIFLELITFAKQVMFSSLFVCLSVSNVAQKLQNGFV